MAIDVKKYARKCGPVYHALSILYVYLNRHSQLCDVPIDICTNPMGFSFAPDGWNYLIEQLKQFDTNWDVNVEDSVLYRFHQSYQPEDMSDLVLSAGFEVSFKPGLSVYPWGSFNIEKSSKGGVVKDPYGTRFYGPSTFELIENDLLNLRSLYGYMKIHGYRPWYFRNAFIGGVFLEKENNEKKYVVLQGNHRTAIMAHLGCKTMLVRYLTGYYKRISKKNICNWYYVKSGDCSPADALAYFDCLFSLSGTERAKKLDLK